MKKRSYTMRYFKCCSCGTPRSATKASAKRTKIGHIKTMFCCVCNKVTDFEQVE